MDSKRRTLLTSAGLALSAGLAGCIGSALEVPRSGSPADDGDGTPDGDGTSDGDGTPAADADRAAAVAVAAEWSVYRARLFDAVALGQAGATDAGADVAAATYARFEGAGGEWGAHEQLEHADHDAYETFEGAIERIHEALGEGDVTMARSAAVEGAGVVRRVTADFVDEDVAAALDLAVFAARTADVGALAAAGHLDAAATVADGVLAAFEDAPAHGALEDASREAYEAFESGLKTAGHAAGEGDAAPVGDQVASARAAALEGAYALAASEHAAAGEIAAIQARGWDVRAIARLGDGETAAAIAHGAYEEFEAAEAHEVLEDADHDTYEAFEHGLEDLESALADGGDIDAAMVAFADASLRAQFAVVGALETAPVGQ